MLGAGHEQMIQLSAAAEAHSCGACVSMKVTKKDLKAANNVHVQSWQAVVIGEVEI